MKTITRRQAINELIADNFRCIMEENEQGEDFYIKEMMMNGFKGYDNYTIEELQREYDSAIIDSRNGELAKIID